MGFHKHCAWLLLLLDSHLGMPALSDQFAAAAPAAAARKRLRFTPDRAAEQGMRGAPGPGSVHRLLIPAAALGGSPFSPSAAQPGFPIGNKDHALPVTNKQLPLPDTPTLQGKRGPGPGSSTTSGGRQRPQEHSSKQCKLFYSRDNLADNKMKARNYSVPRTDRNW